MTHLVIIEFEMPACRFCFYIHIHIHRYKISIYICICIYVCIYTYGVRPSCSQPFLLILAFPQLHSKKCPRNAPENFFKKSVPGYVIYAVCIYIYVGVVGSIIGPYFGVLESIIGPQLGQ